MKKVYHKPQIECCIVEFQACLAASDLTNTTLDITDENVDTSHKVRRQDVWDDDDENDF